MKKGQVGPLGIIILAILVFALLLYSSGEGANEQEIDEETILSVENVGEIGSSGQDLRHIRLGNSYVVYKPSIGKILEDEGPWKIAKGLLTLQEHQINFDADKNKKERIAGGAVSFRVAGTNNYGSLIVSLNGKTIWAGNPAEGEVISVEMGPHTDLIYEGENTVTISCTSSGWRIWAPAYYEIDSFQISEKSYENVARQFEFSLSEGEINNLDIGRVIFNVESADNSQDLIIKINDAIVFTGRPGPQPLPYTVDFSSVLVNLKKENNITFSAQKGASYSLSDIRIIIFTNADGGRVQRYDFEISQEQIKKMQEGRAKGEINFRVREKVSGNLEVIYTGEEDHILFNTETDPRNLRLSFTDTEAIKGKNTITFKSNGEYEIGALDVKVVSLG